MEGFREGRMESSAERVARQAELDLESILDANPQLEAFAPFVNRANAAHVLQLARAILTDNPQLLDELAHASKADERGMVSMLVIPSLPLVLTDSGFTITALAPVLTCTRNAIERAFPKATRETYGILTSYGDLDEVAMHHAFTRPEEPFNFNAQTMNPADYIALAVNVFFNETFRLRFTKGDSTFTPLE